MKTEELNEYLFANLIYKFGQKAWRRRVEKMSSEGNEDAFRNTPITTTDLREGLKDLEYYRNEGLKLLQESHVKSHE